MATSFSNPDHDVNDWSLHSVAARRDSVIQPGKFTWTPLSKSEAEIRICRIKPGPEDSSIQVSLRNVKLKESAGQYTCLSYAWVNKRLTHGILLNDFYYPVPRNLHLQLSRLRVLCLTEDLWIDLVCIDQENDDERSQQVGLMGSIFSSANKVILGVDEGGRLQQPSTIEKALLSLSSGSHLHEFDCSACSGTEQNGELSTNTIAAKQVRRIIAASFWTRCWTVQEIVLAREVVVMGEWGIFPWSLLQEASQAYDSHRRGCCASFVDELAKDVRSRCYKLYSHIGSLMDAKDNLDQGQHLIQILQLFQELNTADSRDKLFAFWGLASGDLPAPEYKCDSRSVFVNIAKWILEDTKDLLLLAMGLRADPLLPSWVPNFGEATPFEANYWRRRLRCLETYNCAKGIEWSMKFEEPETLCLQGIVVDRITEVAKQRLTSDDLTQHSALLQKWQSFVLETSTSDRPLDRSFYETMVAGCSHHCSDGSSSFPAATKSDLGQCQEMLVRVLKGGSFDDDSIECLSIMQAHLGALWDRVLFRTRAGRLGLGPLSSNRDDEVWVLARGPAPFVLRQASGPSASLRRHLIGHAYVSGIMHGEAIQPGSSLQQCRLV